jgi:hypothetical protein
VNGYVQAGLAHDHLCRDPVAFDMPPAPKVLSVTTAAEMTELYWMAVLRDVSFDGFTTAEGVSDAASDISEKFSMAVADNTDPGRLRPGVDVPGSAANLSQITGQNIFRLGLPGEDVGPMVSQFFIRDVNFGTQTINQRQRPYTKGKNYLTKFDEWFKAQESGNGVDGKAYPDANTVMAEYYEPESSSRYISTMRDLARFVNKDALHQAYFNATLLLLSGKAAWTPGNPYGSTLTREAGFGTLGGPHILALVSEVATRALKIVWNQKWQVNLRLRPEAYGGLVHVQAIGLNDNRRPYGLPDWVATTRAADRVRELNKKSRGGYATASDGVHLWKSGAPGIRRWPCNGCGSVRHCAQSLLQNLRHQCGWGSDANSRSRLSRKGLIPMLILRILRPTLRVLMTKRVTRTGRRPLWRV